MNVQPMATTAEDAPMQDAVIEALDFSEGALEWLLSNQDKLEDMVRRGQRMYNLEEWETFERWANNETAKLEECRAQMMTMQRELQRMQDERTQTMARLIHLEQREKFAQFPQDWRTGFVAMERLVCDATRDDEQPLPPAGGEERIMDRLDILVGRMAHRERRRMQQPEEQRGTEDGNDWDARTSLLARRSFHELLRFN